MITVDDLFERVFNDRPCSGDAYRALYSSLRDGLVAMDRVLLPRPGAYTKGKWGRAGSQEHFDLCSSGAAWLVANGYKIDMDRRQYGIAGLADIAGFKTGSEPIYVEAGETDAFKVLHGLYVGVKVMLIPFRIDNRSGLSEWIEIESDLYRAESDADRDAIRLRIVRLRSMLQGYVILHAAARIFLARWHARTAPPPPCPTPDLHSEHYGNSGCFTCFTSGIIARDFQQAERRPCATRN